MKKANVPWLFAVIVLSCLLVLSIVLGVTGYYFSVSYLSSDSELVVGDTVDIHVKKNQASVMSFTFDGGYLPNEVIPQVIQISSDDLQDELYLRVKARVFGSVNEEIIDFVTTDHFEQDVDGYFYYDEMLKGGNKVTFCNYVSIPNNSSFTSKKKYVLTLVVETLEKNLAKEEIWKNS